MALTVQITSGSALYQEFIDYNRGNNFSTIGADLLFDYLDEFGGDDDTPVDIIGLCCDFTEYDLNDVLSNFDIDLSGTDLGDYVLVKGKPLDFDALSSEAKDNVYDLLIEQDWFIAGDLALDTIIVQG